MQISKLSEALISFLDIWKSRDPKHWRSKILWDCPFKPRILNNCDKIVVYFDAGMDPLRKNYNKFGV